MPELLAYDVAMRRAGEGPVTVLNLPEKLVIWSTPLAKLPRGASAVVCNPDSQIRERFAVEFAVGASQA